LRFFRQVLDAVFLASHRASSLDLSPLFQVRPVSRRLASRGAGARRPPPVIAGYPKVTNHAPGLLSRGLPPFSVLTRGSDSRRAYLTRLRSALRFFQPRSALLPPWPSRPCFMPLALLGFRPPEPSLDEQPWRLSTPAPLLTLPPGSVSARYGKPCAAGSFPLDRLQGFPLPASPFRPSRMLFWDRRRCSPGLGACSAPTSPRVSHDSRCPGLRPSSSRALQAPLGATRRPLRPLPCAPEYPS
jgi:hypothetical protein